MSYAIHGIAYNTRNDALTALIAAFVSADGLNDLDAIRSALHEQNIGDTASEIVRDLGDGEAVTLGQFEEPADHAELVRHMTTHSADIIGATP